ncbi:13394_t:CDS:1 [Gigaspora margarita]|uniref:13394_t:CDS:1 n=1 Tax=Gigaspora margarita TaxID=4874 RepID=A0ABN7V359_GIGMA|nr:13394_t:CDS:1 [Gigaspora margarita]
MTSKSSIRLFVCTLLLALLIIQAIAVPLPKHSHSKQHKSSSTSNAQTPSIQTPDLSATLGAQSSKSTKSTGKSSKQSSGQGQQFQGDATFFNTGLGACGISSNDNESVAALSSEIYDKLVPGGNPNQCTACGKTCKVCFQEKCTDVTIVDRCPNCPNNAIDLSPTAFSKLASQALGRISVTYTCNF